MKRIDLFLPSISYDDAVSNHALALQAHFRKLGFVSSIYGEPIDSKLSDKVLSVEQFSDRDTLMLPLLWVVTGFSKKVGLGRCPLYRTYLFCRYIGLL